MATETLHVPNVSCEHCVRRITKALNDVQGVQAVRVDIPTKEVEVTYEGADTPERVRATLDEIGYPPAE